MTWLHFRCFRYNRKDRPGAPPSSAECHTGLFPPLSVRHAGRREVARNAVERYAALGHPISYYDRSNRQGYKAGALQDGMKTAKGEFIAIFDADFMPPADFLLRTIHHFTDAGIGMVQTRWTHINR